MECLCGEQQCVCAGSNDVPPNDQFAAGWYAAFEYMKNMHIPAPPNQNLNSRPEVVAPVHNKQEGKKKKPVTEATKRKRLQQPIKRRARREVEVATRASQSGVRSVQETDAAVPTITCYLLHREDSDFDYERVHRGPTVEEAENGAVPVKTEPEEEDGVFGIKTEPQEEEEEEEEEENVFGLRAEPEEQNDMRGLEIRTRKPRTMLEFESEDEQEDPMPAVKTKSYPQLPARSQQRFKILEAPGKAKDWAE